MIRPEIQPGTLPCPAGQGFKKAGLQQAVFMMAFFRPRIGKQHPDFPEGDTRGQCIDQFAGLGLDKVTMGEPGALSLALGPADPVADHVHADAEGCGKFRGIAGEKMTVPAADFQCEDGGGGNERSQLGAQGGLTLGDVFDEFRFGSHAPL